MSFDAALAATLVFEGGYVNNPLDPGGATNRGITQRTYDAWRNAHSLAMQPVTGMTDDEERAIYLENYWMPCRCDDLPDALAAAVFDMAVNSGVWNAKLALQRAVSVQADGVIGPETLAAVAATPDVLLRLLKQRAGLIAEIVIERPTQSAFLHGWINRLLEQAWKGPSP